MSRRAKVQRGLRARQRAGCLPQPTAGRQSPARHGTACSGGSAHTAGCLALSRCTKSSVPRLDDSPKSRRTVPHRWQTAGPVPILWGTPGSGKAAGCGRARSRGSSRPRRSSQTPSGRKGGNPPPVPRASRQCCRRRAVRTLPAGPCRWKDPSPRQTASACRPGGRAAGRRTTSPRGRAALCRGRRPGRAAARCPRPWGGGALRSYTLLFRPSLCAAAVSAAYAGRGKTGSCHSSAALRPYNLINVL